jgi:hypothetical protein
MPGALRAAPIFIDDFGPEASSLHSNGLSARANGSLDFWGRGVTVGIPAAVDQRRPAKRGNGGFACRRGLHEGVRGQERPRRNPTHLPAFAVMYFVSRKVAPMLDTEFRSLVQGFRVRAEEILLRAETMHDVDVCLKLREIAASYERLARRIEQREPRKLVTA